MYSAVAGTGLLGWAELGWALTQKFACPVRFLECVLSVLSLFTGPIQVFFLCVVQCKVGAPGRRSRLVPGGGK